MLFNAKRKFCLAFFAPSIEIFSEMKRIYLYFALMSAAVHASIAGTTLIETGFESPDDTKFFDLARFAANPSISESPEETIKGNASIIFDNMNTNARWPDTLILPKESLKKGKLYICSFKYKVLELGKGKRNHAFFEIKGADGKKSMADYQEFGREIGETGQIKCSTRIPADCQSAVFRMTSYEGARLAIDDFKFEELDWNGEWFFDKSLFFGVKNTLVERSYAPLDDPIFSIPREKFFPMIDKYGQFKHRDWPGKSKSDPDFQARKESEAKYNAKLSDIKNRDKYGGYLNDNFKFKATGKFRVQKVGGKWFLITPEGNLFWSVGANAVAESSYTTLDDREFYFESLDKNFIFPGRHSRHGYKKEGEKSRTYSFNRYNDFIKHGSDDGYARAERNLQRMKKWGFNTVGAWSHSALINFQEIPYVIQVNSPRISYLKSNNKNLVLHWADFPDFFEPEFDNKMRETLSKLSAQINSPYCIGVIVDNELSWQAKNGMIAAAALTCPPEQPTKKAFLNILKKKYSDISKLNAAWGTSFKDWAELSSNRTPIESESKEFASDMDSFEEIICKKYFTSCRDAVKSVSPDTLYISCRFAWRDSIPVNAAGKICDIVAMNLYGLNPTKQANLPKDFPDVPILIGEYTFARIDKGNFGVYGICACRSEKERVKKFNDYISDALANPHIIGAHWFQWGDQPVTGRPDGENFAFGIVDICDTPDYAMTDAFRKVSRKMYAKRLARSKSAKQTK